MKNTKTKLIFYKNYTSALNYCEIFKKLIYYTEFNSNNSIV